jgi:cobyrinic acid a,c-diamide synthase
MRPATLSALVATAARDADLVVAEGVMGLFDGAATGDCGATGSTADAAAWTGWPVVLVVDVRGQGASAAAVVRGFRDHRRDVALAGVVFNRVGSAAHRATLERAMVDLDMPVLGCVPRDPALALDSRHLGLKQAGERADLDAWIDAAAQLVANHVDLDRLAALAQPARAHEGGSVDFPLLGRRIAVARAAAFAFSYPHVAAGWEAGGARLSYFSPLADEPPSQDADAVYLPGGYPELYADKLAANRTFLDGIRTAAARRAAVYGECGGFMVLGRTLADADGVRHEMAGLLPLESSFAAPRLHLGYRRLKLAQDCALGRRGATFRGHEFHYAAGAPETFDSPLFEAEDASGRALPPMGCQVGTVTGSFAHLLDKA